MHSFICNLLANVLIVRSYFSGPRLRACFSKATKDWNNRISKSGDVWAML